jgi:ubiquinone/menaquinone biosynthesis C-methylase UbiE
MLCYLQDYVTTHQPLSFLDIGCGTGGPAFYLHKKFHATITGIAISEKEIHIARQQCIKQNLQQVIDFQVADGQQTGLPTASFDTVFIMESSLLFPDKKKLFDESFRVLKPGGMLILCDQMKIKPMPTAEMYRQGKKLEALINSFGKTKTETLAFYEDILVECGFSNIELRDISSQVMPTPLLWKQNCLKHRNDILEFVSQEKFDSFVLACDALQEFMEQKFLGYGIVKGVRN